MNSDFKLVELYDDKKIEKSAEDINYNIVKNIFYKKINPNPILIIISIILLIGIIYYLYKLFFQKNITGEWYNTKTFEKYKIKHNPISNVVHVYAEWGLGEYTLHKGFFDGKIFTLNGNIGVNLYDKIYWIKDGDAWELIKTF